MKLATLNISPGSQYQVKLSPERQQALDEGLAADEFFESDERFLNHVGTGVSLAVGGVAAALGSTVALGLASCPSSALQVGAALCSVPVLAATGFALSFASDSEPRSLVGSRSDSSQFMPAVGAGLGAAFGVATVALAASGHSVPALSAALGGLSAGVLGYGITKAISETIAHEAVYSCEIGDGGLWGDLVPGSGAAPY